MKSENKVAIVTGSARGIGRGCAFALAKAGFNIVVHDYIDDASISAVKQTVKEINELGVKAVGVNYDIADLHSHKEIFDCCLDNFGRIDCLVSNAGVSVKVRGDILDVEEDSFDRCIAVNTKAPFFLVQECAKRMLADDSIKSHRSIVIISSSNAYMASINRSEYCVSKCATSMTAKLFALRLIKNGIGVYEIRPGLIMTDMTKPSKEKYDKLIAQGMVPEGRWGYPEDIGQTVSVMAEGKLPYTCAHVVAIDGGMSIPNY